MEVKFARENVSQTLLEAKMQFICATDGKLVSNNESIIASYSSDTQYALARDSYGEIPGRGPG